MHATVDELGSAASREKTDRLLGPHVVALLSLRFSSVESNRSPKERKTANTVSRLLRANVDWVDGAVVLVGG